MTCFVTKAMPIHGKLLYVYCYVSKCNKIVQLVVQVKYYVNVVYSHGADTHTHTHTSILTSWIKVISRNQACASQRPAHARFTNNAINWLLVFKRAINMYNHNLLYSKYLPVNIASILAATAFSCMAGDFSDSINCCQLAFGWVFSQYQNISVQLFIWSLPWLALIMSRCDSWSSFNNCTPNSYHWGATRGITSRIFFFDGLESTKQTNRLH